MGKDGNLGSLDFGELNVFISSEKGHEGGDVLCLSKRCCSKKKLMSYPIANSIIEPKLPFHRKAGVEQKNFITCMIRRGVRSDVQMSCTETRFQKCSQSGKNGSKHPMLSIPMAYNVISCKKNRKKHSKTQNR